MFVVFNQVPKLFLRIRVVSRHHNNWFNFRFSEGHIDDVISSALFDHLSQVLDLVLGVANSRAALSKEVFEVRAGAVVGGNDLRDSSAFFFVFSASFDVPEDFHGLEDLELQPQSRPPFSKETVNLRVVYQPLSKHQNLSRRNPTLILQHCSKAI